MPSVNRAASDRVLAERACRWVTAAEQKVMVMTVGRHDRRGRPNQEGVTKHRRARRSDTKAVGVRHHAKEKQKRHGERL